MRASKLSPGQPVRVAIVSDIHGNLSALEAVIADLGRRRPDAVLHAGDLALMGPQPGEVIDRIRELGWPGVVGNTDELLWRPEGREEQLERVPQRERAEGGRRSGLGAVIRLLFDAYAPFTRGQLDEGQLAWLRGLPAEHRLGDLLVVHASPGDLWRAPMPDAADEELERVYGGRDGRLVVHGHIHRPYVRRLSDELTVANTGSVGLTWDGDPRASYLLIEDGRPEVVRVAYDIEREVDALLRSGHPDGERIAAMRSAGVFVTPGSV
jgi:predicted phosphodiesterase